MPNPIAEPVVEVGKLADWFAGRFLAHKGAESHKCIAVALPAGVSYGSFQERCPEASMHRPIARLTSAGLLTQTGVTSAARRFQAGPRHFPAAGWPVGHVPARGCPTRLDVKLEGERHGSETAEMLGQRRPGAPALAESTCDNQRVDFKHDPTTCPRVRSGQPQHGVNDGLELELVDVPTLLRPVALAKADARRPPRWRPRPR